MRVIGVDPRVTSPPTGVAELVRPERMNDVLAGGDFVIVTVPETPATRGMFDAAFFVRMKRGATLGIAQASMEKTTEDFRGAYPKLVSDDEKVAVASYHEQLIGDVRPALLVLVSAVCFLLLIACANVANLLLARATARSKEIAIRAAMGAGRARLMRQLLTESALLAAGGGALGLLLARWSLRGLLALTPGKLPRFGAIAIDGRVLVFTLLVALATGLVFGLAPALQMVKIDLNDSLREAIVDLMATDRQFNDARSRIASCTTYRA
jgi:putative ABC transport system permease protein